MNSFSTVFRVLLAMLLAAFASLANAQAPVKTTDGVLTDKAGMTLYTFDADSADKSACVGSCAVNWPPLTAQASDKPEGDYTIIKRDAGRMQWAYKGKPLYTWAKDQKPGDKTGDGLNNNQWHVAKP